MGNENSVTRLDYTPLFDDGKVEPSLVHVNNLPKPTSLLKTHYHGVWSMLFPSGITPGPRIGHCFVYDAQKDRIIIAYGKNDLGDYLNDIWELDIQTDKWKKIPREMLSPRSYPSATLVDKQMFIFGGENKLSYFGDLHCFNIDTYEMVVIDVPGSNPAPRASPVLIGMNDALFLWSGTDGKPRKAVHVLRAGTNEWHRHEIAHSGRAAPAYCMHRGVHYVFGSSKGHGLLVFDHVNKTFEPIICSGIEPPHEIEHAAICGADECLFLVGGTSDSPTMHIYALDLNRNWWFAFHIRPDMESLSLDDGSVSKVGLFTLPREHSTTVVYQEKTRSLVSVLGSRMCSPPPTFQISIGPALAAIHMRSDMFEALHCWMSK